MHLTAVLVVTLATAASAGVSTPSYRVPNKSVRPTESPTRTWNFTRALPKTIDPKKTSVDAVKKRKTTDSTASLKEEAQQSKDMRSPSKRLSTTVALTYLPVPVKPRVANVVSSRKMSNSLAGAPQAEVVASESPIEKISSEKGLPPEVAVHAPVSEMTSVTKDNERSASKNGTREDYKSSTAPETSHVSSSLDHNNFIHKEDSRKNSRDANSSTLLDLMRLPNMKTSISGQRRLLESILVNPFDVYFDWVGEKNEPKFKTGKGHKSSKMRNVPKSTLNVNSTHKTMPSSTMTGNDTSKVDNNNEDVDEILDLADLLDIEASKNNESAILNSEDFLESMTQIGDYGYLFSPDSPVKRTTSSVSLDANHKYGTSASSMLHDHSDKAGYSPDRASGLSSTENFEYYTATAVGSTASTMSKASVYDKPTTKSDDVPSMVGLSTSRVLDDGAMSDTMRVSSEMTSEKAVTDKIFENPTTLTKQTKRDDTKLVSNIEETEPEHAQATQIIALENAPGTSDGFTKISQAHTFDPNVAKIPTLRVSGTTFVNTETSTTASASTFAPTARPKTSSGIPIKKQFRSTPSSFVYSNDVKHPLKSIVFTFQKPTNSAPTLTGDGGGKIGSEQLDESPNKGSSFEHKNIQSIGSSPSKEEGFFKKNVSLGETPETTMEKPVNFIGGKVVTLPNNDEKYTSQPSRQSLLIAFQKHNGVWTEQTVTKSENLQIINEELTGPFGMHPSKQSSLKMSNQNTPVKSLTAKYSKVKTSANPPHAEWSAQSMVTRSYKNPVKVIPNAEDERRKRAGNRGQLLVKVVVSYVNEMGIRKNQTADFDISAMDNINENLMQNSSHFDERANSLQVLYDAIASSFSKVLALRRLIENYKLAASTYKKRGENVNTEFTNDSGVSLSEETKGGQGGTSIIKATLSAPKTYEPSNVTPSILPLQQYSSVRPFSPIEDPRFEDPKSHNEVNAVESVPDVNSISVYVDSGDCSPEIVEKISTLEDGKRKDDSEKVVIEMNCKNYSSKEDISGEASGILAGTPYVPSESPLDFESLAPRTQSTDKDERLSNYSSGNEYRLPSTAMHSGIKYFQTAQRKSKEIQTASTTSKIDVRRSRFPNPARITLPEQPFPHVRGTTRDKPKFTTVSRASQSVNSKLKVESEKTIHANTIKNSSNVNSAAFHVDPALIKTVINLRPTEEVYHATSSMRAENRLDLSAESSFPVLMSSKRLDETHKKGAVSPKDVVMQGIRPIQPQDENKFHHSLEEWGHEKASDNNYDSNNHSPSLNQKVKKAESSHNFYKAEVTRPAKTDVALDYFEQDLASNDAAIESLISHRITSSRPKTSDRVHGSKDVNVPKVTPSYSLSKEENCESLCKPKYRPVCAQVGLSKRTFSSLCDVKIEGCMTEQDTKIWHTGICNKIRKKKTKVTFEEEEIFIDDEFSDTSTLKANPSER